MKFVTLFAALALASPAVAQTSPLEWCDALAAHPNDPQRTTPGVAHGEIDVDGALPACEAAAQQNPDLARIQFQFARVLDRMGRDQDAVAHYRLAVERGSIAAMANLGLMVAEGRGLPQSDPAEGVEWFRRAAERGYPLAYLYLGHAYAFGHGVTRSDAAAVLWYRRAADSGLAAALVALASLIEQGRGTAQDEDEAARLLTRAAEQGLPDAYNNLAWLHATRGRLDEARDAALRAYDLDSQNPAYADTLAYIMLRAGQPEIALPLAEFAAASEQENPQYLERFGDALLGVGQRERAREAWRRARQWTTDAEGRERLTRKIDAP